MKLLTDRNLLIRSLERPIAKSFRLKTIVLLAVRAMAEVRIENRLSVSQRLTPMSYDPTNVSMAEESKLTLTCGLRLNNPSVPLRSNE